MFQDKRAISLSELMEKVVPTSRFSKFKVEQMAKEQLDEGKDFCFVSDNILFKISSGSVSQYFAGIPVEDESPGATAETPGEPLVESVKPKPRKKAKKKK